MSQPSSHRRSMAAAFCDYKSPDLVLIDRAQTYSVQMMQENKEDWTLLYQDELAQLWGRTDKYGNPFSSQFVPPERRVVGDDATRGLRRLARVAQPPASTDSAGPHQQLRHCSGWHARDPYDRNTAAVNRAE